MERDLRAEGWGPDDCYPETHKSKGVVLRLVRQRDINLGRFYEVDNYLDLVDAQERHIEKLQEKLSSLRPTDTGRPSKLRV